MAESGKSLPETEAASALTPRTRKQATTGACKQPRESLRTLSLAGSQPGKKPMTGGHTLRLSQAVTGCQDDHHWPMDYFDKQLTKEESLELKELIEGSILGLARDTKATFKGISERDGAIICNYTKISQYG